eukprot:scaffold3283_cov30-Phaeocystis_antarctica.AAC.1
MVRRKHPPYLVPRTLRTHTVLTAALLKHTGEAALHYLRHACSLLLPHNSTTPSPLPPLQAPKLGACPTYAQPSHTGETRPPALFSLRLIRRQLVAGHLEAGVGGGRGRHLRPVGGARAGGVAHDLEEDLVGVGVGVGVR